MSELPEIIGIAIGFIILLVTFGAFVAAGLPIVTAIIGVAVSLMGITALTAETDIASPTISLAVMLGLACGIDYALFILSRYRTYLLQNVEAEEAGSNHHAGHHLDAAAGNHATSIHTSHAVTGGDRSGRDSGVTGHGNRESTPPLPPLPPPPPSPPAPPPPASPPPLAVGGPAP